MESCCRRRQTSLPLLAFATMALLLSTLGAACGGGGAGEVASHEGAADSGSFEDRTPNEDRTNPDAPVGEAWTAPDAERREGSQDPSGSACVPKCARGTYCEGTSRACRPIVLSGFKAQEVTFPSGSLTIAGTLLIPGTQPQVPLPGVVLVHGSGPQDRNETAAAQGLTFAPFKDLAEGLAARGFAVLRYDKRTCSPPSCKRQPLDPAGISVLHFADDAQAALKWLGARPEVDSADLVLAGHSQGVTLVPIVANRSPGVREVILLMGSGRGIDLTVISQLERLDLGYRQQLKQLESLSPPPADKIAQLKALIAQNAAALTGCRATFAAIRAGTHTAAYACMGVGAVFWVDWIRITGAKEVGRELGRLEARVLAINSPTDWNVTPDDYGPLHTVVKGLTGGRAVVLSGLTHMMTPINLSSGRVTKAVLDEIGRFLLP